MTATLLNLNPSADVIAVSIYEVVRDRLGFHRAVQPSRIPGYSHVVRAAKPAEARTIAARLLRDNLVSVASVRGDDVLVSLTA